jgi:hypothetical protein
MLNVLVSILPYLHTIFCVTKILRWGGDGSRALFSDSTLHSIIQGSVSGLFTKEYRSLYDNKQSKISE